MLRDGPIEYEQCEQFRLRAAAQFSTVITEACAGNKWVGLAADGALTIAAGFTFAASGPIKQDATVLRGALAHDALYMLMRECGLSLRWRRAADELLRDICIRDGMPEWQARMVYVTVRAYGQQYADGSWQRPVLIAPAPVVQSSLAEWVAP